MRSSQLFHSSFLKGSSERLSQIGLSSKPFVRMSALDSVYTKTWSLKELFERSEKLADVLEFTNDLETILQVWLIKAELLNSVAREFELL